MIYNKNVFCSEEITRFTVQDLQLLTNRNLLASIRVINTPYARDVHTPVLSHNHSYFSL